MAITITWKSSVYVTTNTQSTYTCTPTWTPQAGSLLVAFVCTAYSANPSDPTGVTGHGLTYSKLTLGTSTLGTTHKFSAWVAKAGASPSAAACVAAVTSTNGTGGVVIEFEVTGADLSAADVLAAIVDSTATNNGTGGSETVTLAAPNNAANRALIFGVQLSNAAQTASGSWVISGTPGSGNGASGNFNTPATGAAAAFRNDAFDTAGALSGANVAWRMVGIEVKAGLEGNDSDVDVALTEVASVEATDFGPVDVQASDPSQVVGSESVVGEGAASAADAAAISQSESPFGDGTASASDDAGVAGSESPIGNGTGSADDAAAVVGADASALLVEVVGSDATAAGVSEPEGTPQNDPHDGLDGVAVVSSEALVVFVEVTVSESLAGEASETILGQGLADVSDDCAAASDDAVVVVGELHVGDDVCVVNVPLMTVVASVASVDAFAVGGADNVALYDVPIPRDPIDFPGAAWSSYHHEQFSSTVVRQGERLRKDPWRRTWRW